MRVRSACMSASRPNARVKKTLVAFVVCQPENFVYVLPQRLCC